MAQNGPFLEVKSGGRLRRVPLPAGPLTIGRNITNLLVIDEVMASRFHCVIDKTKTGFRVRDMDSRNGTLLNGQPVKMAELKAGDIIAIGSTELHFNPTEWGDPPAIFSEGPEAAADPNSAAFLDLDSALEPAPLVDVLEPAEEA